LNAILNILILFSLLSLPQEKLQYNNGRPTSKGIDDYVNSKSNQEELIKEYQNYIKDTIINDIFFRTENFKKTRGKNYDPEVLGYNVVSQNYSCEIIITDEEKFSGFGLKQMKGNRIYDEYDYFLKATIFHEISHYYFLQCILELRIICHKEVNQYYDGIIIYPNPELKYGAEFIEEGICEYLIEKWGETLAFNPDNIYTPKSSADFSNKDLKFEIQYKYASKFVRQFLDLSIEELGKVKYGIMILLQNRPPNYEEMQNSNLYYNRLKLEIQGLN
jgi:hypothetical protein